MLRRCRALFILLLLSGASVAALAGESLGYEVGGAHEIYDPAEGWQHLWNEMLIDITAIGVIFALVMLWFLVKYRRKHPDQEGKPTKLSWAQIFGWAIIPVFLFMADDLYLAAKGWSLWNDYRTVPEERIEVRLESAMWSWNFTYEGGVETTNELRVPAGTPVLVRMTSRDTIHSLYLPEFKVKEDSMPGRVTYLWFYPKKEGEYLMTCAEYCGLLHSNMHGKVIAMEEAEYYKWLENEKRKLTASAEGAKSDEGGAG